MDSASITRESKKSVKWSFFSEFFAKLATPLSTAILARILVPEIFGITAAVSIVVSFCEAITDTGFAKFIIQHDFNDEDEYKKYIFVSLIFSIGLSAILFVLIYLFRYQISSFIGNSGYENILVISCAQLPFFAINSIFIAHLRRNFKFNKVFIFKIIYSLTPFVVTLPLALFKLGPWALVIGAIFAQAFQTPFLLWMCRKYVKPFFSFKYLGSMIRFSYLMIIESVLIWMSTWLLTFVSSQLYSPHIVGIVKVANSTVTNIFTMFSLSFTQVMFASLSRLKNDKEEFQKNFYSIQSCAFAIIVPLSMGCFFYSDVIVKILLGDQWSEASGIIAALGASMCLKICFSNFVSEVFRSKGHFLSSIIYHIVSIGVNILLKFTIGRESLSMFAWTTALSYLIMAIVAVLALRFKYGFSIKKQGVSLIPSVVCSCFMLPLLILQYFISYPFVQSILQVILCVTVYLTAGFILFKPVFKEALSYLHFEKLFKRKQRKAIA